MLGWRRHPSGFDDRGRITGASDGARPRVDAGLRRQGGGAARTAGDAPRPPRLSYAPPARQRRRPAATVARRRSVVPPGGGRCRGAQRKGEPWRRSATRRCSSSSIRPTCSTGAPRRRPPASRPASWSASTSTPGRRSRARRPSPGPSWARSGTRTSLPFGTAVTCPGFRYHPAVIAHAAATLGAMFPGRFWLGPGRRRGAQRAHHRRRVAGDRHPLRDDVRGHRGHQQALHRRASSGTAATHFRLESREALHPPGEARSRSTSRPPARSTRRRPGSSPTG